MYNEDKAISKDIGMAARILIVDDQAELRRLVRLTLEYGGNELHEADNGVCALQLLDIVKPELVVLDVMMPGDMDGYRVCDMIKRQPGSNIKVVMLSAKGQQADLKEGRLAGADAYLIKPFSPLELIATVERLLAN